MARPRTNSFFVPKAVRRTQEEWEAIEPGFAARERDAYEWVFTEVWLMAIRFTAHAFRGRAAAIYHDIMDLSGDASVRAMAEVLRWVPGKGCCLRTWAYIVTDRLCRKARVRHRVNGRWNPASLDAEDAFGRRLWELTAAPQPDCELEAAEKSELVRKAIDKLHRDYAMVIKRHYGIGVPRVRQRSQAEMMGVTKQAVSLRLIKGEKLLAKQLANRGLTYETI